MRFIPATLFLCLWVIIGSYVPASAQVPDWYRQSQEMQGRGEGSGIGPSTRAAGKPAGCPSRWCGCGLSVKIFGRIVPHLNLAANWQRSFPRTSPAPGMVAARRGHVFQLIAERGVDRRGRPVWLSWDPNSGGGRLHIHDRSIAGYTIVDPRGASL